MLVTQHPVFRRFWYPVIPMEQLADGPKPFTLLGTRIVLWLDAEGKPAATQDRCCHRTAQLSRGFCENGNIVCGYHGWTFDRTGACVRVPQITEAARQPKYSIPGYHCQERYGYAWVALAEPLYGIPEIPEASTPGFRRIHEFYEPWECAALAFIENGFDLAHPSFVHRGTFGSNTDLTGIIEEITPFEGGFRATGSSQVRNSEAQKKNLGMTSETTTRLRTNAYWMPFAQRVGIGYPNGLNHIIVNIMTPIDDRHSQLVQFCFRNDTEEQAPAAGVIAFDRAVTLEDKYILETVDPDILLTGYHEREKSMGTDRPGLLIRKMLHELLVAHGEAKADAPYEPEIVAAE